MEHCTKTSGLPAGRAIETVGDGGFLFSSFRNQANGPNTFLQSNRPDNDLAIRIGKRIGRYKRYYGSNAPTTSDYNVEALRAIALFRLGRDAEARKTILAIKSITLQTATTSFDTLMSHYIHWKDNTVIAHLTCLRGTAFTSLSEQKTREAVVEADIRYQTEQKEKENRLLSAEVELKSSRLQTFIFTGLFLLAIGVGIGGWLWMRLRLKEREKLFSQQQLHEQSQRLQQLITSRQELNNRNEELLRQLVDIQATHDKNLRLRARNGEPATLPAHQQRRRTVPHRLRFALSHRTA